MTFTRIGQWAQLSDCGKYTVCCIKTAEGHKFEAWFRGNPDRPLGLFSDAEAARQSCREHEEGK